MDAEGDLARARDEPPAVGTGAQEGLGLRLAGIDLGDERAHARGVEGVVEDEESVLVPLPRLLAREQPERPARRRPRECGVQRVSGGAHAGLYGRKISNARVCPSGRLKRTLITPSPSQA